MFETFYGFSSNPFQLNPDPSFYFESKGHGSAYAYLKYGVFQSEGFLVITGEIGAGKTTLVRALLEELDPHKVVAAQLVSTQLPWPSVCRSRKRTRRVCSRRWRLS
jgi:general secretion pathway protein A